MAKRRGDGQWIGAVLLAVVAKGMSACWGAEVSVLILDARGNAVDIGEATGTLVLTIPGAEAREFPLESREGTDAGSAAPEGGQRRPLGTGRSACLTAGGEGVANLPRLSGDAALSRWVCPSGCPGEAEGAATCVTCKRELVEEAFEGAITLRLVLDGRVQVVEGFACPFPPEGVAAALASLARLQARSLESLGRSDFDALAGYGRSIARLGDWVEALPAARSGRGRPGRRGVGQGETRRIGQSLRTCGDALAKAAGDGGAEGCQRALDQLPPLALEMEAAAAARGEGAGEAAAEPKGTLVYYFLPG